MAGASRVRFVAMDRNDPLRSVRYQFSLPEGVVDLDGDSLGARPRTAVAREAKPKRRMRGSR